MIRAIHIHGALGAEFGTHFNLDVADPREAIRALVIQIKGFGEKLKEGAYRVIRGPIDGGYAMDETELGLRFGKISEFHIIPVIEGEASKGKSIGKIVLGVALIGAAFIFAPAAAGGGIALSAEIGSLGITYANVALFGGSLLLSGFAQFLTKSPKAGKYHDREVDRKPSFIFNGPVNVAEQGNAVALVYGRVRVGSVVGSSGISPA
jgi:predicted phage tail protein